MKDAPPAIQLVHSASNPDLILKKGKKARLGVVRSELGHILENCDDATRAEISRMIAVARKSAQRAILKHFGDRKAADSVEESADPIHSTLEDGILHIRFGFTHNGWRRVISTDVDSNFRIGRYTNDKMEEEARFSLIEKKES